jgi:hypothetical protein
MKKKIGGFFVCMLIITIPSGMVIGTTNQDSQTIPEMIKLSATYSYVRNEAKSPYLFIDPVPDLHVEGAFHWTEIKPGGTAEGRFRIANIGEPSSLLHWTIESFPDWGTWSFTATSGYLTPEIGGIQIGVEVIAPNKWYRQFEGEIKVVNVDDSSDYGIVPVILQTPVSFHRCYQQFFGRFPNAFPLLRILLNNYLGC